MPPVTFQDCQTELLHRAGPLGRRAYTDWLARPGYGDVVRFVGNFTHDYLFQIRSDEIRRAIHASHPALGNVHASEQIGLVEDFTTPFAFQHLFHWFLEDQRKVPTWTEFRNWMVVGGPAGDYWHAPLKALFQSQGGRYTEAQWSRAARWRLGKVYNSNIRELYLLVRLREAGVALKYHLLADVLLRVDFWLANVLVCTWFANPTYRSGDGGRKAPAQRFFEAAAGP